MRGIKIPLPDFALKMQGAYARGGAYLWDTTVVLNACSCVSLTGQELLGQTL